MAEVEGSAAYTDMLAILEIMLAMAMMYSKSGMLEQVNVTCLYHRQISTTVRHCCVIVTAPHCIVVKNKVIINIINTLHDESYIDCVQMHTIHLQCVAVLSMPCLLIVAVCSVAVGTAAQEDSNEPASGPH